MSKQRIEAKKFRKTCYNCGCKYQQEYAKASRPERHFMSSVTISNVDLLDLDKTSLVCSQQKHNKIIKGRIWLPESLVETSLLWRIHCWGTAQVVCSEVGSLLGSVLTLDWQWQAHSNETGGFSLSIRGDNDKGINKQNDKTTNWRQSTQMQYFYGMDIYWQCKQRSTNRRPTKINKLKTKYTNARFL